MLRARDAGFLKFSVTILGFLWAFEVRQQPILEPTNRLFLCRVDSVPQAASLFPLSVFLQYFLLALGPSTNFCMFFDSFRSNSMALAARDDVD